MRILLYTKEADETRKKRKEILESNFKERKVETFPTAGDLTRRLREPSEETKIVILLVNDHEDLKHFVAIQHLFLNIPLIIQVPDDSAETLQMAHRLRPRYLNGPEADFGTLVAVLRKILNHPQEFSGGTPKTYYSPPEGEPPKRSQINNQEGKRNVLENFSAP